MRVVDIYTVINDIAPFDLAESWDNVGILVGGREDAVRKILVALDCTDNVIEEAKKIGANLIITHHPIIFDPIKKIDSNSLIYKLISNKIAVISAHTNLDAACGGVNDVLAAKLELEKIEGMGPMIKRPFHKIVVFVPNNSVDKICEAMYASGAGDYGKYKDCTFSSQGIGTFTPQKGAKPTVGKIGKNIYLEEVRIEMICNPNATENVLSAMMKAHPYELPAYDVFENHSVKIVDSIGIGRVGNLKKPMIASEFAKFVKEKLGCKSISFVDTEDKEIKRIGVCGGSGGGMLEKAQSMGADAFVTGDIRHDTWLWAKDRGMCLVDGGHYYTEKLVIKPLINELKAQFPKLEIKESETEKPPVVIV